MASSSQIAGAGADDNAVGTLAWSNPGNITADDGSNAEATASSDVQTHYLKATSFGFSIPTDATVDGIEVTIDRHCDFDSLQRYTLDNIVRLVISGSVSGDNKADTANKWPTTPTTKSYGGASDLWGLGSVSPSTLNASNFGVVLSADVYQGIVDTHARVDYIQVTVHYTPAGAAMPVFAQHYGKLIAQ